jgi:hypothetical protein
VHTHAHSRNDSYLKRLRYSVLSAADADALNFCSSGVFSSKICGCTRAEGVTDDEKTARYVSLAKEAAESTKGAGRGWKSPPLKRSTVSKTKPLTCQTDESAGNNTAFAFF